MLSHSLSIECSGIGSLKHFFCREIRIHGKNSISAFLLVSCVLEHFAMTQSIIPPLCHINIICLFWYQIVDLQPSLQPTDCVRAWVKFRIFEIGLSLDYVRVGNRCELYR